MAHHKNYRSRHNKCGVHPAVDSRHPSPAFLCDLEAQLLNSIRRSSHRVFSPSPASSSQTRPRSHRQFPNYHHKPQHSSSSLSEFLRLQIPGIFASFDYLTESLKDISAKLQLMLEILLDQHNLSENHSKSGQSTSMTMTNNLEQCQPITPSQQRD